MDNFEKITPTERKLLEIWRSLQPYEAIVIEADKDGKVDRAWVKRESKFMLHGVVVNFTKVG